MRELDEILFVWTQPLNYKISHMASPSFSDGYTVKLNFLAHFSHELRTPLAQILGPVEQLQNSDGSLSESERKRLYGIIGLHTNRILDLVERILDTRAGGPTAPQVREALLEEALGSLGRETPAAEPARRLPLTPKGRRCSSYDDELLGRLTEIMEANLDDTDFNVHKMCGMVHLSHMHFIRKVKQLTGKKPIDLLKSFRLKRAKDLLRQQNLTVAEVAYKVGYDMPNSFSRAFKKEFGMSPSEYVGVE
jgi:AraC-like DNA-binding protein